MFSVLVSSVFSVLVSSVFSVLVSSVFSVLVSSVFSVLVSSHCVWGVQYILYSFDFACSVCSIHSEIAILLSDLCMILSISFALFFFCNDL